MNKQTFVDKVRAVLFGTAYGDAIGAPVEKLCYAEIKERYGRVTDLKRDWYKKDWPGINKVRGFGTVTDDTLMTIALMNIYNEQRRHLDAYDMADGMVKEIAFKKTYIPEFEKVDCIIERLFYPEKWIFMRHTLANCEPREGGIGNMINCGAAMYIAPIGIVNALNPLAAYNEAIAFAQGHQASYGLEAAGVLAACVAKAFEENITIEAVVATAIGLAKDGTKAAIAEICAAAVELRPYKNDHDKVVAAFHAIIGKYSPMGDDVNRVVGKVGVPSNHYTPSRIFSIEELPLALGYCVLHEGDLKVAVIDGINSGRDTDSIGVMAAAICGPLQGMSIFTDEEIEMLTTKNKMELYTIADTFAETALELLQAEHQAEINRYAQLKDSFL